MLSFIVMMSLIIVAILMATIAMLTLMLYHKTISTIRQFLPPPFPPVYMKSRDNIITLFCEGMWASRVHGSLYTGSQGVMIFKNIEMIKVIDPHAPLFIHNVYTYPDFNETNYQYNNFSYFNHLQRFITFFRYYSRGVIAPIHHIDVKKVSISGLDDLDHYRSYLKQMIKETPPDKKIVLFGNSRGGSIILIVIGQLTPEEQQRISLAILEAPYDDIKNVFKLKIPNITTKMGCYLMAFFTRFKYEQLTPINSINNFPINVPVAMITTKVDETVSTESTNKIISKLRDRGVKVHECQLDYSPHASMSIYNYKDQRKYGEFLENMYELYTV